MLLALLLGRPCAAEPAPLRIVAPTNQTMPLLRMEGARPAEGLLKDFGELVARRLGRTPQFVVLPSKRALSALMRGEADLHCYVKPGWLEGDLLWTRPFLASAEVVAAQGSTPPLKRLADLRGEPLGTVLGYVYTKLEAAVGAPLQREDATDADANLRRLAAGRVRYALTDRSTLRYWSQVHPEPPLREVAVIESDELGCALSRREARLLEPINQAIAEMLANGSWERLTAAAMKPHAAPPLRFIAATNNTLPIAAFDAEQRLVGGIAKDLGELIAAGLGRPAAFLPLPSKRVSAALLAGEADAVCFVLPEWLQGDFRWTRGLIPDASVVAAHADAPALKALEQLAGQPVGTVQGYSYPVAEQVLGKGLRRQDVPSMAANLRRLAAGKLRYALVEKTSLQFFLHEQPQAPVRIAWVIKSFDARCAFSPRSSVPFAEVAQVLDRLVRDGSIERMLARYR